MRAAATFGAKEEQRSPETPINNLPTLAPPLLKGVSGLVGWREPVRDNGPKHPVSHQAKLAIKLPVATTAQRRAIGSRDIHAVAPPPSAAQHQVDECNASRVVADCHADVADRARGKAAIIERAIVMQLGGEGPTGLRRSLSQVLCAPHTL